jgi:hypothetical protein
MVLLLMVVEILVLDGEELALVVCQSDEAKGAIGRHALGEANQRNVALGFFIQRRKLPAIDAIVRLLLQKAVFNHEHQLETCYPGIDNKLGLPVLQENVCIFIF